MSVQYRAIVSPPEGAFLVDKDWIESAGKKGKRLTAIPQGQTVDVLNLQRVSPFGFPWLHVRWAPYEGYVGADYVRLQYPGPEPRRAPETPKPKPAPKARPLPENSIWPFVMWLGVAAVLAVAALYLSGLLS